MDNLQVMIPAKQEVSHRIGGIVTELKKMILDQLYVPSDYGRIEVDYSGDDPKVTLNTAQKEEGGDMATR